jgi:hypothetical protein
MLEKQEKKIALETMRMTAKKRNEGFLILTTDDKGLTCQCIQIVDLEFHRFTFGSPLYRKRSRDFRVVQDCVVALRIGHTGEVRKHVSTRVPNQSVKNI